jgi:hypothetical protein
MERTPTQPQKQPRSIDVTGLPEEAIRAVELLVSLLRGQQQDRLGGTTQFSSREEWARATEQWAEGHPKRDTLADDSREAIYADDPDE